MTARRRQITKQSKLTLLDGGAREPLPPEPPQSLEGTSLSEYAALFTVAGIIWIAIGYWIWKWIFH